MFIHKAFILSFSLIKRETKKLVFTSTMTDISVSLPACKPQNRCLTKNIVRGEGGSPKHQNVTVLFDVVSMFHIVPDNYATSSNSSRTCVTVCVYLLVCLGV